MSGVLRWLLPLLLVIALAVLPQDWKHQLTMALLVAGVFGLLAVVWSSAPMFQKLAHSFWRSSPWLSVTTVGLAAGIVCGLLFWTWAKAGPAPGTVPEVRAASNDTSAVPTDGPVLPTVKIDWHGGSALIIAVRNIRPDTVLEAVKLYVTDVKVRRPDGMYIPTQEWFQLHRAEVHPASAGPVHLFGGEYAPFEFIRTPMAGPVEWIEFARRKVEFGRAFQVTLRCEWINQERPFEQVMRFEWVKNQTPRPLE